jgi:beta-1,4-mannooligosaccharide/beta-1,4-mannosyl-N-acetylglucosamine phosphorylase
MQNTLYPFIRYEKNPILTADDVPYPCNTVFNAAACRYKNFYILLLRIEDLRGHSHLTLARSNNGYDFSIDSSPLIKPSDEPEYKVYEEYGVEDPRITLIDGTYYICYTAYGPFGVRVGIGSTSDFVTFERISLATEVDNKDAVLFPERIKGEYAIINRPGGMGGKKGSLWISYSPDLIYWGKSAVLMEPEPGWGSHKLGISTPPIKTEKGWLSLYHGVRTTAGGNLYRIGAMLMDLEDPAKVTGYTTHFIFGPSAVYERTGDVPNVVFPCGIIQEGNRIKMYYGAADTCIALAEADLSDILRLCDNSKER